MDNTDPLKPICCWYQFGLRALLLGPLLLLVCGASKDQQAIDAFDRGVDHVENGEHDEAIADFAEAIRLDPTLAIAHYFRGLADKEKGEQANAEADFAKSSELGYEPE